MVLKPVNREMYAHQSFITFKTYMVLKLYVDDLIRDRGFITFKTYMVLKPAYKQNIR